MVKRSAVFMLFAAVALFWGSISPGGGYDGPKIEARETRYDFGKVKAGSEVVHVFEIKNVGSGVLEIHKIQSS